MQNWGRNNSRFPWFANRKIPKFIFSRIHVSILVCLMDELNSIPFCDLVSIRISGGKYFLFTGKLFFFLGNFSCRRLFIILIIIYFFTLKIRQTFIVVSANFLSVFLFLISIVFSFSISKRKWKIKIFFVIRIELTSLQRNPYQLMLWIHWFR